MKISSFFLIIGLIYLISNIAVEDNETLASECVNYDATTKTIDIICGSYNLSQLKQELDSGHLSNNGTDWLLSANLRIGNSSIMFINATDTDWLKIKGDSKEEYYGIVNHGTLIIDNTKISSWNTETNDHVQQNFEGSIKRPYITSIRAQGPMNITGTEISYLGFHHSPEQGLSYHFTENSKIDNNNIHNLWYGFYTDESNGIDIINNHVHHNFKYGIDPHTSSYNLLIKNNTVHDTLGIGIICSLDCYDIIIENNIVYNNKDAGIMFSRNMTNSIVRYNIIHDEVQAISISDSFNNKIYSNIINNTQRGLHFKLLEPMKYESNFENYVYNNTIKNSLIAIRIDPNVNKNFIHNNTITNSEYAGILISNFTNTTNEIYDNLFSKNKYAIYSSSINDLSPNEFINLIPVWCKNEISHSNVNEFQYLAHTNEIISDETTQTRIMLIPAWVQNNICWWSEELISDVEFESSIEYLTNKGIIRINTK